MYVCLDDYSNSAKNVELYGPQNAGQTNALKVQFSGS